MPGAARHVTAGKLTAQSDGGGSGG